MIKIKEHSFFRNSIMLDYFFPEMYVFDVLFQALFFDYILTS